VPQTSVLVEAYPARKQLSSDYYSPGDVHIGLSVRPSDSLLSARKIPIEISFPEIASRDENSPRSLAASELVAVLVASERPKDVSITNVSRNNYFGMYTPL